MSPALHERDLSLGVVVTNYETWELTRRCLKAVARLGGVQDVVVVDDEYNPGHAEIRAADPAVLKDRASKALRGVFKLVQN